MIEHFNNASREQKLAGLYKAEEYINSIHPYAENYAHLLIEKEDTERSAKKAQEDVAGGKSAVRFFVILSTVLAVLWLALPEGLLKFFVIFCLIPSALMSVVMFCITLPGYKKAYAAAVSRLQELPALLAVAEKEVEAVKQQHIAGFSIWYELCRDCKNPRTMRQFISYFESGRAETLKEAKNLLAQEQHQGRLEELSKEQIITAENARQAAERAARNAQSAASAAAAAQTSSNATWWEVKRQS